MLSEAKKSWVRKRYELAPTFDDENFFREKLAQAMIDGELTAAELSTMNGASEMSETTTKQNSGPTADQLLGKGKYGNRVNVLKASQRYSDEKRPAVHAKTGRPVYNEKGKQALYLSESENAKSGAIYKRLMRQAGIQVDWTEHDQQLLDETIHDDRWCGKIGGQYVAGVFGDRVKALLNDGTSGGTALVPEWYDERLVTYPLVFGELFPLVNLIDIPRGSAVETASVGNVSITWGTAEGTSIGLFDTASLVASIGATVQNATVAVEYGRDLAADSPADVGRTINDLIGTAMVADFDRVVALGNGTMEPEGVFNATGVTDLTFGGDAATVSDYEQLLFGVAKQYRDAATRSRQVFIGNETSYQRARSIAVGTDDQRRVFGMDHESYTMLGHPYKIVPDLPNTNIGFANLSKYRIWRRGFEIRVEGGGKELALKNLLLVVGRARLAGQLVESNAAVITDDAEA